MNKTNKYYVDQDGNMVEHVNKNILKWKQLTELPTKEFHEQLEIVNIGYLNSGCYFILKNSVGKLYYMNDTMMGKYLKKNSIAIEGDWDFYQQGAMYSIGPKPG